MEMMSCPKCRADNSIRRDACYNCGTVLRPEDTELAGIPETTPPALSPRAQRRVSPDLRTDVGRRRKGIALAIIGLAVGLPILYLFVAYLFVAAFYWIIVSAIASAPPTPPIRLGDRAVAAPAVLSPPPAPIPAAPPAIAPRPALADSDAQPGPSASLGQRLAWLKQHRPFLVALWWPDIAGYDSNPFVRPQAGNTFIVLRVAVGNVGYDNASVNEFGFSYVAEGGVSYAPGFGLSPMVKRSLPSVSLADGAWTWGYIGFEIPEDASLENIKCGGFFCETICLPNVAEVRKALDGAGIAVPTGMMPDPSA